MTARLAGIDYVILGLYLAATLAQHAAAYPIILATSAQAGAGIPELRAAIALLAAEHGAGEPAEVVTKRTPCSMTKSTMFGSRTKACAMFTPKGRSVSSRILSISTQIASSSRASGGASYSPRRP